MKHTAEKSATRTKNQVAARPDGSSGNGARGKSRSDAVPGVANAGPTEQERSAEKLHEYEKVVESLAEMIAVIDRDYRYMVANRAFLRHREMTQEQVVGHFVWDVLGQDLFENVVKAKLDESFTGKIVTFEMERNYAGVGMRDLLITYLPIDGPNGIDRVACVLQDITLRKLAEEALKESQAQMAEAQHLAHVGSWSWEVQSGVLIWSDELFDIFGEDRETFTPSYESYLEHVHPEDREATAQAIADCLKDNRPFSYRRRIVRPDGEIRVIDSHGSVSADEHGKPLRLFGACQDVTASVRAEEGRRLAEQKYQDIFENAGEGIFQSTPDGRYLAANPALARMHGFSSPEELIRERTDISRDAYADPERREEFKRVLEAKGSVDDFEFELCRADGQTIWVSINARAVRDEQGAIQYYEGMAQDITEKKQSQEAVRQSEERYRELFENSRDAIYVHDLGGRYVSVNPAAERLSGYDREEILGKHYSNFISPAYLRDARENFCRKLDVPVETTYEAKIVCKDGSFKPVEVSSRMIYRDGEPVAVQGTVRDITERKHAQQALQIYARRLMQAQEVERENIARELHDEIGQVLTAVNMNLEWIRRSGATKPAAVVRVEESMEIVAEALKRVRELSLELRPSLLDDLGLAAALRWYTARYSARTGISARVIGDVPKSAGLARSIETACFRIAQEALTNTARHARAIRASITLEPEDDQLELTISDDGVGFEAEKFLNGNGISLALGLRGMQERALAVHGRINIKSEIGVGTKVTLLVPMRANGGRS
jgi:PAS domain S-box-containing protein